MVSPGMPRMRLRIDTRGLVGLVATTMSPACREDKRGDRYSVNRTSPREFKVGFMEGPTLCVEWVV